MFLTYWKPIALIVVIIAVFYAGFHYRGQIDQIASDKAIQAQVEANQKAQDELNVKAKNLEDNLTAERAKSSDLKNKWSKINAKKHTVCQLSSDTIGLLRDATAVK